MFVLCSFGILASDEELDLTLLDMEYIFLSVMRPIMISLIEGCC